MWFWEMAIFLIFSMGERFWFYSFTFFFWDFFAWSSEKFNFSHLCVSFFSRVVCKCGSCGPQKLALSEWERHTGSKIKNWRTSIRVKGSLLPLEQWVCVHHLLFVWLATLCKVHFPIYSLMNLQMMQLAEYHARAVSTKHPKRPSIKERKQKLLIFLQGIFLFHA